MLNIFQIASNDQSIYYLSQIFGYVGDVLPVQTGSANLIFGVMFKVFNTVALTVGAFILTYATVVGLLQTAHEGEFLGKKWAKLWVPIRMVMGTAALFPAASGYSMIQVLVMWTVVQGIGAADTLWTAVLNYISTTGSPYSTISPDTTGVNDQMERLFQGLVCQASTRLAYRPVGGSPFTVSWYCADSSHSQEKFCTASDDEIYNVGSDGQQVTSTSTALVYNFGPQPNLQGNISCGAFSYTDPAKAPECQTSSSNSSYGPNNMNCLSYTGQQQSLQNILPILGAIAQQYALTDYQYAYFYETPVTLPGQTSSSGQVNNSDSPELTSSDGSTSSIPDWIQNYCNAEGFSPCCVQPTSACPNAGNFAADIATISQNNYDLTNTSNQAADVYSTYSMIPYLGPEQDFIDSATNEFIQEGITGPYVTYITTMSANDLTGQYKQMADYGWITAGQYYYYLVKQGQGNVQAAQSTLNVTVNDSQATFNNINYRSNATSATELMSSISGAISNSGLGAIANVAGQKVSGAAGGVVSKFISDLSSKSGNQPIVSISISGLQMMMAAQTIFLGIPTIIVGAVAAGTINPIALGTGITLNPIGEAIKSLVSFFTPFALILVSALFSVGALLGIYLPLIPFFLYIFAAIGWFIGTIEAMVASPLVALGILSPGGQHEIFGRAEPSVMIIFNLTLRPTLIVFGLVAAMIASSQVIRMFNAGFAYISGTILQANGLVEQIIFMGIYTSVIITVVSKIFSLIYWIPERVITYISGHGVQYGEGEALSGAKSATEASAGGMARGGQRAGGAAVQAPYRYAKAEEKQQADAQQGADAKLKPQKKDGE